MARTGLDKELMLESRLGELARMATRRLNISNAVKKRLRAQAGNKCANPGCHNTRTHFHHIREWHVYATHDEAHMIALCPSCHDAVHISGVSDDVLYSWKSIEKTSGPHTQVIYVEPGPQPGILFGSIRIVSKNRVCVVRAGGGNHLSIEVQSGSILRIPSLVVNTYHGESLVNVTNDYVVIPTHLQPSINFAQVPGSLCVTVPATEQFVPAWVVDAMRQQEPMYASDGRILAIMVTVVEPGVAKLQGCWCTTEYAIVATSVALHFIRPGMARPTTFVSENYGEAIFNCDAREFDLFGFAHSALFNMGYLL